MSDSKKRERFPEDFGFLGTGTGRTEAVPPQQEDRDTLLSRAEERLTAAKSLLKRKLSEEQTLLRNTEKMLPEPSGIFRGESQEDALPVICRMLMSWEALQKELFPAFFILHTVEALLKQSQAAEVRMRAKLSDAKMAEQGAKEKALFKEYQCLFAITQEATGSLSDYLCRQVSEAADLSGDGKRCRLQTVRFRCGEVRDRLDRLIRNLELF